MKYLFFLPLFILQISAQYIYSPFGLDAQELASVKAQKVKVALVFASESQQVKDSVECVGKTYYNALGQPTLFVDKISDYLDDSTLTDYMFLGEGNTLLRKTVNDTQSDEMFVSYTYNKKNILSQIQYACIDPPHYTFKIKGKKIVSALMDVRYPEQDEEGNFTGEAVDVPRNAYTYAYNKKGQIVEEMEYTIQEGERLPAEKKMFFYEGNKLLKIETYRVGESDAELIRTIQYSYDAKGLLQKEIVKDEYDEETLRVFKYVFY